MTFEVREELAHHEVESRAERCQEAAALCRFAGALHILGGDSASHPGMTGPPLEDLPLEGLGGPHWVVALSVPAVARRLQRTLVDDLGIRPTIEVHRPSGLRRDSDYRLAFALRARREQAWGHEPREPKVSDALAALGLCEPDGSPRHTTTLPSLRAERRGWLRGAAMAALIVSRPARAPHLELRAPTGWLAEHAVTLMGEFGAPGARATVRANATGDVRHRVVVRSGEQIGALLAGLGAHQAFLERDLRRLERGLRSEANRSANADRANLDRAATAAARQTSAITAALDHLDATDLPQDVLQTALARLANPGSTLSEIGALLDPPVGRATVHRRIQRLIALAGEDGGGSRT